MLGGNHPIGSKESAKGVKIASPAELIMHRNKSIFCRGPEERIFNLSNSVKNLTFWQYFIFSKKINDKNIKNNSSIYIN
jgi:hypothetical protein